MSTTINNLTDLQNMKNDLTEDYVLGGNIDASGSTTLNATNYLQNWQQNIYYLPDDYVEWDGTRKICDRYSNTGGGGTTYDYQVSFGLKPYPTNWKLRTLRYAIFKTSSSTPPSGMVRMSLWTCNDSYYPGVGTEQLYTFNDITDHIYYSNWATIYVGGGNYTYYYDIWLSLPIGYEFELQANTKYAVVIKPDDKTNFNMVCAYRDAYPPPNLPSSDTTYYGQPYHRPSEDDNWTAYETSPSHLQPNVTVYPHWYYLCNTGHVSQTYLSDDASSWDNYQDIQPPSYLGFEPVGDSSTKFTGTFDGAGYTISDLYIYRAITEDVGLFGRADSATIQDVTLSDVDITAYEDVGGLVGEADGCTVSDCHTSGSLAGVAAGDLYFGGLIGFATTSGGVGNTITDCSSSCIVTSMEDDTGGLIGSVNGGTLTRCMASGNISSDGGVAGGLAGYASSCTISQCYATGDTDAVENYCGGLIGLTSNCTINNCYARGRALSEGSYVGGLVGALGSGSADNCFSTGAVVGSSHVGGLLGYSSGTVTDCFWDTETSGIATSADGTGKSTHNMKILGTFYNAGWDIEQHTVDRNDGYPYLSWEIDLSDTIWKIYGFGVVGGTGGFTFPDLMDDHGRYVKNVPIEAYRTDTRPALLVETQNTDEYGSATFTSLPAGVDTIFTGKWGGQYSLEKEEWFFLDFKDLEDGGTGGTNAVDARDSLGVYGCSLLWELIFGD